MTAAAAFAGILLLLQEPGPEPGPPPETTSVEVVQLYQRIHDLMARAQTAYASGDRAGYDALRAQAWWAMGDLRERRAWEERAAGRMDEAARQASAAEQARSMARSLGFQPAMVFPPPVPAAMPPPTTAPPPPAFRPLGPDPSIWNYHRFEPHPFLRRNTFFAWVQQPPMESAMTHPFGRFVLRASIDYASGDFEDTGAVGISRYNGELTEEAVQLDVGATDYIQVGGRLVAGELSAADTDRMRLFDLGDQIVHRDTRSWNVESLALRVKGMYPWTDDVFFGGLAELKLPLLASSRDYLTGRQIDLAVDGMLSYYWMSTVAVHLQAGVVVPFGDSRLFRRDGEPNAFFDFGGAVVWAPSDFFSVGVQVEGQTSPWSDFDLLDETAFTVSGFTKVQVNRNVYVDFGIGTGLSDLSAELQGSFSITFSY